jgi:CheY-like chemotaxis protein
MPEMDGITATVKLRETGISTPIVATSGHAMPEHFAMYSEAGMNGYLIKPYTREDLLNVVCKWVDKGVEAHS